MLVYFSNAYVLHHPYQYRYTYNINGDAALCAARGLGLLDPEIILPKVRISTVLYGTVWYRIVWCGTGILLHHDHHLHYLLSYCFHAPHVSFGLLAALFFRYKL